MNFRGCVKAGALASLFAMCFAPTALASTTETFSASIADANWQVVTPRNASCHIPSHWQNPGVVSANNVNHFNVPSDVQTLDFELVPHAATAFRAGYALTNMEAIARSRFKTVGNSFRMLNTVVARNDKCASSRIWFDHGKPGFSLAYKRHKVRYREIATEIASSNEDFVYLTHVGGGTAEASADILDTIQTYLSKLVFIGNLA